MNPLGISNRPILAGALFVAVLAAVARPVTAQETFRLVVESVSESRARTAAGDVSGELTLVPKFEGDALGEAKAFRIRVTAAEDDTGNPLLPAEPGQARWEESPAGEGLRIHLASPARGAAAFTVTGTIDLWVPGRDAGAEVKVANALAQPDRPLVSKGLRAAGVSLGLAPRDQAPDGTISITGRQADLERIRSVRVLSSDGSEMPTTGRRTGLIAGAETLEIVLSATVPPDATLVFGLLTRKSVLAVPFELKGVPLP